MNKSAPSPYASQVPPPGDATVARDAHHPEEERSFAEVRKILQDVLRILALHPWAFFLPFCIATSTAFVVSLYSPRTYSAVATFERRDDPVALSLDISNGAASFKFFRKTMVEDLTSVKYMAEVVENLGLTKGFDTDDEGELTPASQRRRDGLARSLANRLSISNRSPGEFVDHVTIRYTGPDSHIGQRLVEETRDTYIRRSREWIKQHLSAQRDYFQKQKDDAEEELTEARRAATRFRLEHPLIDPSDPGSLNVRLTQLENEKRNLLLRKNEHESDLLAQRQLLHSLDPTLLDTPESDQPEDGKEPTNVTAMPAPPSTETIELVKELRAIADEIDELRVVRGMTLQHPDVLELMAKQKRAEMQLARQREFDAQRGPEDRRAPSLALMGRVAALPLQLDRAIAIGKIAAIEAKLKDVNTSIQENETLEQELREAKRNIFEHQEEFAQVRDRVNRARAEYGKLETTLSRIIPAIAATDQDRLVKFVPGPPAQASSLPIAPRAKNIVILSLVIGVAAGVLFVILAEVLDHVYRSSAHVARSLSLPILDSIDEIITTQDRRRILVQRLVATPLILCTGVMLTGLSGVMAYMSLTKPGAYAKVRRIPRAALEFFTGDLGDPTANARMPWGAPEEAGEPVMGEPAMDEPIAYEFHPPLEGIPASASEGPTLASADGSPITPTVVSNQEMRLASTTEQVAGFPGAMADGVSAKDAPNRPSAIEPDHRTVD